MEGAKTTAIRAAKSARFKLEVNLQLSQKPHAVYMRKWRKTHPLSDEQRKKHIARAYARVYKSRGKLIPQPCRKCGYPDVEMHHTDYTKPLLVDWLCTPCHQEETNKECSP